MPTVKIAVLADASQARREISGFSSASGKAFGGLKVIGAATGAALASIAGVSLVKGFQRLDSIDKAKAKLTGLGNSADNVQKIMGNALAAVKGTSFGLGDAAGVAASAVASGIKPGAALQKTLTTVANSAAVAGTSFGDMGSIFTKVAATNKLQGDTLAQLGDRGIPILQLLSKQLGVSTADVSKLASQGKIDFATFQAAMSKGMGAAAKESGKTFSGSLANVQAALGRLGAGVLGGLFAQMPAVFQKAVPIIDSVTKAVTPLATAIGTKLGAALLSITSKLGGILAGLDFTSLSTLKDSLNIPSGASGIFSAIAGAVKSLVAQLPAIRANLAGAFQSAQPALQAFGASLPQTVGAVGQLGAGVLTLATGALTFLTEHMDTVVKLLPVIIAAFLAWRVASSAAGTAQTGLLAAQTALLPVTLANTAAGLASNIVRLAAIKADREQTVALGQRVAVTQLDTASMLRSVAVWVARTAVMVAQQVVMVAIRAATVAWAAAQWLLNAAMTANPIGLVVLAIVALVAVFILAWKHSETFRTIVTAALRGVQVVAAVVWNAIKVAALAVWTFISAYIRLQIAVISAVIRAVVAVASAVWNAIRSAASAAWSFISGYIRLQIAIVRAVIQAVLGVARTVWNGVKAGAVIAFTAVKSAVTGAISAAKEKLSSLRTEAAAVLDRIKALFSPSALVNAGQQLIAGLAQGIRDRISRAVDAVRNGVQQIKNLLPGSPIKDGPLKGWNNGGAGKRLMDLLAGGISAGVPGVRNSLAAALDPISALPAPRLAASAVGVAGTAPLSSLSDVDVDRLAAAFAGQLKVMDPRAEHALVRRAEQFGRSRAGAR